ncbi:hypothetical protein GCM10028807_54090 [Spirosoma daeguense]
MSPNKEQFMHWCHDVTLGGKGKKFWWKLDAAHSLTICREFKGDNLEETTISFEALKAIQEYVHKTGWTDMANSVSKLGDKTEREGLGKFLHETLKWGTTEAQLASQLFALFVHAGIWVSNDKQTNIQVKNQSINWFFELEAYYFKNYRPDEL